MYKIHFVEDEKALNDLISKYLKKEGWRVECFLTGNEAQEAIELGQEADLWILDIMLPDIDGYQLIKLIKDKWPLVPVIFISARDKDFDRIVGLEMGSDDYLAKPFLPRELVIRVSKILQRVYGSEEKKQEGYERIINKQYLMDIKKREIREGEEVISLSSKEFDFIYEVTKHPGRAYAREELLSKIWGEDYFGSDRVVDDLVRRVRKKLPGFKIETIYGFGYRWCNEE